VLVLSDDHSYPHLSIYGDPVVRTPNLDGFARQGMRFHRMFTAAPQCVPSRAAYLSGRSAVAARMTRFSSPLPPDVVTLPDVLRANGYFTGICRRNFHLDGPGRPAPELMEVFDRHGLRTFEKRVDYLDRNSPREQTAAKLTEFFDKRPSGKPFFLWVNFNDPHHPWDQKPIDPPYDPARIAVPPHLPDLPGVRDDLARYYGEIARMDREFHIVLEMVERRGGQNTIVVFAGDNGQAFPHGKGSLYDPGLNVPLLIRWPGQAKADSESRELISGEDIAPTLLEAAGLKPAQGMTGHSFLRLLRGERHEGRRYVFAERGPHGNSPFTETTRSSTFDLSRCVRSQRHKLIYNCTPQQIYSPVDSANDPGWRQMTAAARDGRLQAAHQRAYFTTPRPVIELYDLEADPSELTNLGGRPEMASVERELKLALQEKMILDYDYLPLPLPGQ
jgi:arylsulfatase A-like enzyme